MIQKGQTYRHADLRRRSVVIRIEQYTPGHLRALAVDAATGKEARRILVSSLHESALTASGTPRRNGYVLMGVQ